MKKATIYDYARMCASFEKCNQCVLHKFCADQRNIFSNDIDKANEIILKWCKEHPIKTRQSEFLKMFPNAATNDKGRLSICPKNLDGNYGCEPEPGACGECMDKYWLAEVEEWKQ